MPSIEANALAGNVDNVVHTSVAEEDAGIGLPGENENYERWNEIIFDHLIQWARHPEQFEDDDIEPPSIRTIDLAIKVARSMRDNGVLPPLRAVPNGDGGVAFERRYESTFEALEVGEDGSIEVTRFENSKLVLRLSLA